MTLAKTLRKLVLLQCAAIVVFSAHAAFAGNVGVNLNINIGEPPRQVIVTSPPPAYVEPADIISVEDDIHFVYPSALGFYVAVGVPYDLFYVQNSYFLFRDGRWLRAPGSHGPWVVQSYRNLPQGLRRYRLERIRDYRSREYVIYNRDPERYAGKHFRSDKEQWKEQRKEAKERRKEERRFEKEERHDRREGRDD